RSSATASRRVDNTMGSASHRADNNTTGSASRRGENNTMGSAEGPRKEHRPLFRHLREDGGRKISSKCRVVHFAPLGAPEINTHRQSLHRAARAIRQACTQQQPAPRKGTAREQYPYRPGFTRSNPTDNSRIGQVRLRVQPRTNSILAESNPKLIRKPSEPFPLQSPPNSFAISRRGGIVNGGSWRRIGSTERGATSKHQAPKEEKEDGPRRGGAQRARGNRGNGSKLRRKERRSSDRNESKGRRHSPRRHRHTDSDRSPPHSDNGRCILCGGEHFIRRCPYREEAKEVALKKLARKRDSDSKDKKRKKKAYSTEEITIRAESVGGEDCDIILSSDSERAFVALADDNARLEPLNISRHAQCGDGSFNVTQIGTPTVECGQDKQVASAKITGSYCRECMKKQWEILCSGKNSGRERQYILSNKITVADRVTKPLPASQSGDHWDERDLVGAW